MNVNQSESRNDFFTCAKTVSSNQREPEFTYQRNERIRSRLHDRQIKVFGEDFFKLPAISFSLKFFLSLNWTSWTISHVYKDLQCYETKRYVFEREIHKQEERQLY